LSEDYKMKILTTVLSLSLYLSLITACGGGGGGGGSSTTTQATSVNTVETEVIVTDQYEPDSSLLLEEAESSSELYVSNSFRFNSHKTVIFNFTATNQQSEPLSNTLIKVSSILDDIEDLNDEGLIDRELLSVMKTDGNGQIYRTLELPQGISTVLVELNAMGIENTVILDINDLDIVTHNFL